MPFFILSKQMIETADIIAMLSEWISEEDVYQSKENAYTQELIYVVSLGKYSNFDRLNVRNCDRTICLTYIKFQTNWMTCEYQFRKL
jgi:hypothetical protein